MRDRMNTKFRSVVSLLSVLLLTGAMTHCVYEQALADMHQGVAQVQAPALPTDDHCHGKHGNPLPDHQQSDPCEISCMHSVALSLNWQRPTPTFSYVYCATSYANTHDPELKVAVAESVSRPSRFFDLASFLSLLQAAPNAPPSVVL